MANVIHKITFKELKSVNTPDYTKTNGTYYDNGNWVKSNDMAFPTCDKKYWKWDNSVIVEMTLEEKAVVDFVEPTPETTLAETKAKRQGEIKLECKEYILAVYPLEKQASAALGIYPAEYITTMSSFIASCIEEENIRYDAIEACITNEAVDIIVAVFPEVV